MTIGKKGFGLDPFQSTAVIHGEVGDDGHLHGSLIRQGGDHQDLSIGFEGMAPDRTRSAARYRTVAAIESDAASRLSRPRITGLIPHFDGLLTVPAASSYRRCPTSQTVRA
jgi:hypothetical protein